MIIAGLLLLIGFQKQLADELRPMRYFGSKCAELRRDRYHHSRHHPGRVSLVRFQSFHRRFIKNRSIKMIYIVTI